MGPYGRGGDRGGGFGGGRGGGGRGGRGGGRGGGGGFGGRGRYEDQGPPEHVIALGHYVHPCQNTLLCKVDIEDVPYFNAPIYLENKQQIGKIDEILGTLRDYYVSVTLSDDVKATAFKPEDKLYIDPAKLLPIRRFLPGGDEGRGGGRGRGGGGRGGRGGRGGGGFGGGRGGGGRGGGFGGGRGGGGRGGGGFGGGRGGGGRGGGGFGGGGRGRGGGGFRGR